jgi:hypothetical protein
VQVVTEQQWCLQYCLAQSTFEVILETRAAEIHYQKKTRTKRKVPLLLIGKIDIPIYTNARRVL